MARFIDDLKRSHHCGDLRATDEGKEVVLFGWVASYRDHGGCVFVDLRDREGITQVGFDPDRKGHGDLRRPPLQRTLRVRHRINQTTRRYFDENGFLELETPVMCKYTPGGARNFLVPSRMHPGKFFALAESPQLFKQLYMVAGFDKYF